MISENTGKRLTVQQIADEAGYDRSHLHRLFKAEIGMGIHEYIEEVDSRLLICLNVTYERCHKAEKRTNVERVLVISPADSLPLHPPAPAIAPATIAFSPAGRTEELPQLAGDTLPAVQTHRIERLPLDRRRHTCRDGWRRMIPTHVKVQYAGGMGFLSFGAGWDYGRKCQWETDLYLGFLPRSKADKFYVTTTAKQSYIPWSIACGNRFAVEPFYCGMYVNTIIGEKFWVKEPDRYPRKYYTFSTKIHTFLFIGQRLTLYTNRCTRSLLKGVTAYYELSTCDLYLISAVTNKSLDGWDIVGLSFGVKLQLF